MKYGTFTYLHLLDPGMTSHFPNCLDGYIQLDGVILECFAIKHNQPTSKRLLFCGLSNIDHVFIYMYVYMFFGGPDEWYILKPDVSWTATEFHLDELFPWYLKDHEPYERLSWQRTCFTREHQLMGRGHEMFPTDRQETLHHWASPETIYIVYINRIVSLLLSSLLYIYKKERSQLLVPEFWSLSFHSGGSCCMVWSRSSRRRAQDRPRPLLW